MTMGLPVLCAGLAGCFNVSKFPICVLDPEPVADDVEVAGWTGADLLAIAVGERVEDGTYYDGGEAVVSVAIARAGSAEYVHTTPDFERKRKPGFGTSEYSIHVPCADYVRVPVSLQIDTDDGLVDMAFQTFADGPMDLGYYPPAGAGPQHLWLSAEAPLDAVVLPHGDESPDDWEDTSAVAGIFVGADPDPGLTGDMRESSVGWGGTQRNADATVGRWFYILKW